MLNSPSLIFFKTIILTLITLIAFAANSVLCRLALAENTIDATGFTVLRLLSGAIVLSLIILLRNKPVHFTKGSWLAALMLFLYAAAFSFAYISLDTGTGALILFAAVQITMILWAIIKGELLHIFEWIGIVIAFSGFVYLILPGVSAPSPFGFLLMTTAGIAWGVYSIIGKYSKNPIYDTAYNFIRTVPFIILILVVFIDNLHFNTQGIVLAIVSGGLTSGIGYVIWYMALRGLTATQAAVVQLLVPVFAAFGGVIFISELISFRLVFSGLMILGGISLVFLAKRYFSKNF